MCPHCGYEHAPSTWPLCASCGRKDCLHSPVAPHAITVLRPECPGYDSGVDSEEEGTFEPGGGGFGGGGASGGPW